MYYYDTVLLLREKERKEEIVSILFPLLLV